LLNLRGARESGYVFATPTYLFMFAILGMAAWGGVRYLAGDLPDAPSADFELLAEPGMSEGITGLAGAFLLLRAFSSGCAALTGVEAISNGVPAFRKPKSRNAATTLLLLATLSITMLLSVVALANAMDVR
jgi:amino acid transporter